MSLKLPSSPAFSLAASHTQVGGPTYSTQIFLLDIMKLCSVFFPFFSSSSNSLMLSDIQVLYHTVELSFSNLQGHHFASVRILSLCTCHQAEARRVASGYRGPIFYYLGNIQETPTICM